MRGKGRGGRLVFWVLKFYRSDGLEEVRMQAKLDKAQTEQGQANTSVG